MNQANSPIQEPIEENSPGQPAENANQPTTLAGAIATQFDKNKPKPKNPEITQEKEEKIDLEVKVKEFLAKLPYEEKMLLQDCKWEDTDEKWEKGFLNFLKREVQRRGKYGATIFSDYLKSLKRTYDNTSISKDPKNKKLFKGQLRIAEQMQALMFGEKKEKASKKDVGANEELKSLWGKENIKNTILRLIGYIPVVRDVVFRVLGEDPFWNKAQQERGMEELKTKALANAERPENARSGDSPKESV